MTSPAACPKCGSMDLQTPYHGRRTGLWMSACRDCHTSIKSSEYFHVVARVSRAIPFTEAPVAEYEPVPRTDGLTRLKNFAESALAKLNALDPRLKQSREPGEEG